jgi:hypothetical protein
MSDEFEFPDEQSDDCNSDDDDQCCCDGQDEEDEDEGEEENSPKAIYINAKDNIGLTEDSESIEQFMHVYEVTDDMNLKSKAIGHALSLLAQGDDVGQTLRVLATYIDMANKEDVKPQRFEKRINDILGRSLHSEEMYTSILNKCVVSVDRGIFNYLFYDLKFRQLEAQLNAGLQPEAEKIAKELEENIPLVPNQEDQTMVKYTQRLLITNIELALARGDHDAAIDYYSLISNMPEMDLPSLRVSGVVKEAKGLQFLHNNDYQAAKNLLREAFTDFNNAGSDKRTSVLPYYTIAFMLCRERGLDPYHAQELMALQFHPQVAPMRQLFDAYINNDIVKFDEKLESAKKSFMSEFYNQKLSDIRYDVLAHAIATFTKPYSTISIPFIASQLKSEEEEVRKCIFDLIYGDQFIKDKNLRFGMLINKLDDTLVDVSQPELDGVLLPFIQTLDVLYDMSNQYLNH